MDFMYVNIILIIWNINKRCNVLYFGRQNWKLQNIPNCVVKTSIMLGILLKKWKEEQHIFTHFYM